MLTKEDAGPVRALAPDAPCFSRLSARSALYTDLHVLLDATSEPLTSSAYRSLVIDDNCVARKSAAARRKIWKELKARYILDTGHPLFAAFLQEWRRCRSEAERGLTAYMLLALHDLTGSRFATEREVDEAFAQATKKLQRSAEDLKARIREGHTVVVK